MRFVPGGAAWWAAGAVVVLSACTGPAEAIVTETPVPVVSVSATPSPSPSESVSPEALAPLTDAELLELLPADAVIPDLWGAQVTAVFFLEQYGPMFQTGDTRVWEALSAEDCQFCENAISTAQQVASQGWVAQGYGVEVDEDGIRGRLTDTGASVLLPVQLLAGVTSSADGVQQAESDSGPAEVGVRLELHDGFWVVAELGVEDRRDG